MCNYYHSLAIFFLLCGKSYKNQDISNRNMSEGKLQQWPSVGRKATAPHPQYTQNYALKLWDILRRSILWSGAAVGKGKELHCAGITVPL